MKPSTIDKRFGTEGGYIEAVLRLGDISYEKSGRFVQISDAGRPDKPEWVVWHGDYPLVGRELTGNFKTYVEAANAVIAHFKEKGWAG